MTRAGWTFVYKFCAEVIGLIRDIDRIPCFLQGTVRLCLLDMLMLQNLVMMISRDD